MAKVKVISLYQPWAYLFASGAKKNETRPWRTNLRGELYIHATQKISFNDLELCRQSEHFRRYIPDPASGILVQGAIIGKVHISDVVNVESIRDALLAEERAFGDYRDGRYAWKADGHTLLDQPIFVKGRQGIWEYDLPGEPTREPDMMAPDQRETAERMHYYQHYLK